MLWHTLAEAGDELLGICGRQGSEAVVVDLVDELAANCYVLFTSACTQLLLDADWQRCLASPEQLL